MPCQPEEEFAQGPETEHPVTPTKESRNHGASHADPDAADPECRGNQHFFSENRKFSQNQTQIFSENIKYSEKI